MNDDFSIFLLKSGISAAHELSSHSTSFSWKETALNLFHCYQDLVLTMSIYILNPESENMEEEIFVDYDGVMSGTEYVPVYHLPEELLTKLQPVQKQSNNFYRTLIPLHQSKSLIGFIELRTQNLLSEDIIEAIRYMASALSLGVYFRSYKETSTKDKSLFDAVMQINHEIQSCSNIDELIFTFSKLTIKFLKFDRLTIFIKENNGHHILHSFCMNAKEEIYTLDNVSNVPFEITSPQSLENLSGFWVPIRFKDKTYGIILADNIYTLCEIPKNSIAILSDLCTQLALSIEHIRLINDINKHAQYDDLTGVLNRRMSIEAIEHYIAISNRNSSLFTLCYIDMDHMKVVNDRFGHLAGDIALMNFTQIIRKRIRKKDTIGRVGGDEFIIIFPECDITVAEQIWNRIQEGFEHFNNTNQLPFKIQASHGMAQFNAQDEFAPAHLISIADKMMYKEKEVKHLQ